MPDALVVLDGATVAADATLGTVDAAGTVLRSVVEHATVVDESGNEIDLTVPPPSDDSTTDDTSTTDISTTDTNDERERAEA